MRYRGPRIKKWAKMHCVYVIYCSDLPFTSLHHDHLSTVRKGVMIRFTGDRRCRGVGVPRRLYCVRAIVLRGVAWRGVRDMGGRVCLLGGALGANGGGARDIDPPLRRSTPQISTSLHNAPLPSFVRTRHCRANSPQDIGKRPHLNRLRKCFY